MDMIFMNPPSTHLTNLENVMCFIDFTMLIGSYFQDSFFISFYTNQQLVLVLKLEHQSNPCSTWDLYMLEMMV